MPQIFKIGPYWVYFWSNEGDPLEPVHVHVAQGAPSSNATKIWITSAGGCFLCNNHSHIPERTLRNIMAILETLDISRKERKQRLAQPDFKKRWRRLTPNST